jgi:hypothetical protein
MSLLAQLRGASFCVSYGTRSKLGRQLDDAIEMVGHDGILLVDNGAFTHFKSGGVMDLEHVEGFEAWAQDILARCPQAVAVIPDVIGGTLEQQIELINTSMLDPWRAMAIYHLDEPISHLLWLCESFNYIGIGSAGDYVNINTQAWTARMHEVFAAIKQWEEDSEGAYIRPRIHLMRAQSKAHLFPVDSSDSTNVAVNHKRQLKRSGETVADTAARIDRTIQASAGPEAEHQIKRPLLYHLEAAESQAAFWLEMELARLNQAKTEPHPLDIPEFLRRAA